MLDTKGIQTNAKGLKAERAPIVYLETAFGMRKSASMASYHAVVVAPVRDGDDRVQLIWLRDADTGRVVATRSFAAPSEDSPPPDGPPTLVATLKEPYAGVYQGEKLVPLVLYERDGLWQGEPFSLCGPDGPVCVGSGLFSPARAVQTPNRMGANRIGAAVLEKARP